MSSSTVELMSKGMQCLRDNLWDIESERFIAIILREKFDYTKWQQNLYRNMDAAEIVNAAVVFEEEHPFRGKAIIV